jgi:CHAT domain-containing protein
VTNLQSAIQMHADSSLDDLMIRDLEASYGVQNANFAGTHQVRKLLEKSAEMLAQKNGDHWLEDFLRSKDSSLLRTATLYLVRAIHENQTGEPDFARSSAHKAQQLFIANHNFAGNLRARFEEVYALHRLSLGTDCLAAALALQRSLSATRYPWLQVQTGFELSVCKGLTGDFGGSFAEAESALFQSRKFGIQTLTLRGYGLLAELKVTNGNDDEAWAITRQGVHAFWESNFPPMRGYQLYAGIAFSAENHKEWYLAAALNREANSFVEQTDNLSIKAMAHYRLAGDALMSGDNPLAAEQFTKANLLFASLPQTQAWKAYRAYGQLVLAGLDAQKGQLSRSRELMAESERNLESLPDYVLQLTYLQIEGDLALKSKQPAAAEKAYHSALKIGRAWLQLLHSDRDRLAWNAQMGNIYRALVKIYALDQQNPARALATWEEYRAIAANLDDKNDLNREATADWLKKTTASLTDKTLVAYVQFEDGLGIWLADDRGLQFRWQAITASEMEKKASRFRSLCSDRLSDMNVLGNAAREMYSLLLGPLEARLDPHRVLTVATDTSLAGVPFGALRDSRGHYLIEDFTVVFTPGLAFEKVMERVKRDKWLRLQALIVAPNVSADISVDLLPLRDAILESQEVAKHFTNPTVLSGRDATLERFGKEIASSDVFHFAGHAVLIGDAIGLVFSHAPNLSGVTGKDLLSADMIRKGNLGHLRLVVLAACSTAGGPESDTVGRGNLVGGFMRAGVPHVVGMNWEVDSATTRNLMEAFYFGLETNVSVPNALRSAQLSLRSYPQTSHPFYWAAVSAFGSI